MLNSLRTRLMLSYIFLIVIVVLGVGAGIFWSIRTNPLLYRTTALHLQLVATLIVDQFNEGVSEIEPYLVETLTKEANRRQVRIILMDPRGSQILDTQDDKVEDEIHIPGSHALDLEGKIRQVKDESGDMWLYTTRTLGEDYQLIVTTKRPRINWMTVLREDFIRPIIRIGLISFLVALVFGFGLSKWISTPLRRMMDKIQKGITGNYDSLPLEGPKEVQQLVESYNLMASTVKATQQSQKEFIANVSHEIKTPLTSIKGFAQALMDGTVQNSTDIKRSSQIIFNESERMQRMAEELLSLIKVESGSVESGYKQIDIANVMKSVINETKPLSVEKNISILFHYNGNLTVTGDQDKLHEVFTNLVENGIKFSPKGGKIEILAEHNEHEITIRISDEGPGVPLSEQERIFERFYQVDKSRSGGSVRGAGLGLTIASKIVASHHGKIWVESDGVHGSIINVRLPIVQQHD